MVIVGENVGRRERRTLYLRMHVFLPIQTDCLNLIRKGTMVVVVSRSPIYLFYLHKPNSFGLEHTTNEKAVVKGSENMTNVFVFFSSTTNPM